MSLDFFIPFLAYQNFKVSRACHQLIQMIVDAK